LWDWFSPDFMVTLFGMNPVRFTSVEQPAKSDAARASAMDVRAA
jgi:hypothetical protein